MSTLPVTSPALPTTEAKPHPVTWLRLQVPTLALVMTLTTLALVLRLLTYDRYLPYIDYTDEAVYTALGQDMRGLSDESALKLRYGALPPLYSVMNGIIQTGFDAVKPYDYNLVADYYYVLRLVSVGMGVLTTWFIAWAAWQVGGATAGFMAGFVWACAPVIVEFNSLATPDPTVYMCSVLALATGIYAWRTGARWALGIALLSAIAIVYAKYWVVTMTLPFLVVGAMLLRQNPRRMLPFLVVAGAFAALCAAHVMFGLRPVGNLPDKAYFDPATILDPNRNFNNLWHALYPIGVPLYVLGIGAGSLAYIYSRQHKYRVVELRYVALVALVAILGVPLTSAISFVGLSDAGRIRHILPTGIAFYILWGVALGQVAWTLRAIVAKNTASSVWQRLLPAVPAVGMLLLLLPGYLTGNSAIIDKYNLPHITNRVRDWADTAIPNEGMVMQPYDSDLDRTWNRIWGAYAGNNPLLYWSETAEQISATTPDTYVERNIHYFVINEEDLTVGKYTDPAVRDFMAKLYLLKTFVAEPGKVVGSTTYFYRMQLPQYPASFVYGEQLILEGYDLSATELKAGETLTFRPYWGLQQRPTANYSMFIHVYPADSLDMKTQADGAPASHDARPTLTWDDVDEKLIGRTRTLTLPNDLAPGDYRLAVGIYDYTSGVRLKQGDAEFFTIPIQVVN
jgi:4-amino-4-deoxy-L-arabinose transferase-like glycosyltransferase